MSRMLTEVSRGNTQVDNVEFKPVPDLIQPNPPGDIDGDGDVDFSDFLILSTNFGMSGTLSDGDLDNDGQIAFSDFLVLSANFGESSNAATPEPSTSLLAAFGILGLLGLRRRR